MVQTLREASLCTAAQAATLLGKTVFIAGQMQAKAMRFADRPLIARQYWDSSSTLTPELEFSFSFLLLALSNLPNKVVDFGRRPGQFGVGYSDAEFEPGKPPGFGWILWPPNRVPFGAANEIPSQ